MNNTVDLLIVDEAGQVAPEIAVNTFQLCKRAIVVGDMFQIEPVFSIGRKMDIAKIKRTTLAQTEVDFDHHEARGRTSSSGSIMKLAREASCHGDKGGRGVTLIEHYRCVPEIVDYCNQVVYKRNFIDLKPIRSLIADKDRILPAWGWAQINGTSNIAHQNDIEAMSIMAWLSDYKVKLEKHYGKSLRNIVGVITPFKAQKNALIRFANQILGFEHGVIIGTVHALQGSALDVIIFSPGYGTNHKSKMGFIDTKPNLLNVAVSRAKDSFLVFGNMRLFNRNSADPSGILAKKLFERDESQLGDVRSFTAKATKEEIRRLADTDAHLDFFQESVKSASKNVVIASPYITSRVIESRRGQVMTLLKNAVDRGVNVTVYLDSYGAESQMNKGNLSDKSLTQLKETNVNIRFTDNPKQQAFHNKTITIDNDTIIEGSFNWLSAPRDSKFEKLECSLLYQGPKAFEMIERFMEDMRDLCKEANASLPAITKSKTIDDPVVQKKYSDVPAKSVFAGLVSKPTKR